MAVDTMVTRRRFTRAEYYRMVEVGILRENDRIELIKGEVVEMSPIGRRHNAFVGNLTHLLVTRLAGRAIVWVQSSIALSEDTEPQPDFVVLRRGPVSYKDRDAWAEDALMVIEVADSSLAYDRSTKRRLYAEAGIPEYWLVDCTAEAVEVYRNPGPDGYREVSRAAGTATLTLLAFPGVEIAMAEVFA